MSNFCHHIHIHVPPSIAPKLINFEPTDFGTELTEKGYKLADDRFKPHPPFNDIDFLIGCDQMWRVMTKDVELWPDILAATKNVFGCGTIQPSTNKTNKIEEEQKKKKE